MLILCTSTLAVDQWKAEFGRWSTIDPKYICRFTSANKDKIAAGELGASVLISTYSLLGSASERSAEITKKLVNFIKEKKWGLMILDEVQVAPARTFRRVMSFCTCHCKLGLTATLVREDNLIQDLYFLIGPKLYEANWMALQNAGHIARVKCSEVWVQMDPLFYKWYWDAFNKDDFGRANAHKLRQRLFVCNPNKFKALEYLIRTHEARGDKTLVFSDDIFALKEFAIKLSGNGQSPKYYIRGDVAAKEREDVINKFKFGTEVRTIFCSKIADNSIDLPNANVLIQISSHGAGRRQEAQRLGRILRKKAHSVVGEVDAYFYTIVSRDTKDVAYNKGVCRTLSNLIKMCVFCVWGKHVLTGQIVLLSGD